MRADCAEGVPCCDALREMRLPLTALFDPVESSTRRPARSLRHSRDKAMRARSLHCRGLAVVNRVVGFLAGRLEEHHANLYSEWAEDFFQNGLCPLDAIQVATY